MSENNLDQNRVFASGTISELKYGFDCHNEKFYKGTVIVKRASEKVDEIPIVVPEIILDKNSNYERNFYDISGEYRTYNKDGKLIQCIFANEIQEHNGEKRFMNEAELSGYICKTPILRQTPKTNRDIADFILGVNCKCGKSYYIPCIAWGRNAKYVSNFTVGTRIKVKGRIQSREYGKKISEDEYETRTAYEISVSEVLEYGGSQNEN